MSLSSIGVIGAINECITLFQWAKSAISSLHSRWSGSQQQDLQGRVSQLESGLQGLRDTLPIMHDLINKAEWRSHDDVVASLLPKLKDSVSDAEDLIDEFSWYEKKVQVEGDAGESPFIEFFDSVIQGSFNKLNDAQLRLDRLSSQLKDIGLHGVTQRFEKFVRPETTSFPSETKIFGRDKELEQLLRFLNVPENSKRKRATRSINVSTSNHVGNKSRIFCLPVLPIAGIGGVGKTTLAQLICNHQRVRSHFDLIIWVCVSDDFDVKRLTKEAIQSCTRNEGTNDNLDSLQHALSNKVENKRLLIVLDDMWDEALKENGQCWKRFCAPFRNVQEGSMMLVTTRCPKVIEGVRTMDPVNLEGLKDDVFWNFFKLCAFGSEESNNDAELERIGRGILRKLKGSPLAAKTLGRMLSMDLQASHWNFILESQLWELRQEETDILPALRLSYMYLPFYLKQCFAFCAVYPKDYKFQKERLAEIWVAEGFVEPQGGVPIKVIGHRYFEDLVARSFFQKVGGGYVIHDLLHDMAQKVSEHDCFILRNKSDFDKVPQNVRHLYVLPSRDFDDSNLLTLCKACPSKRIPSSFCWLYNLQILKAKKCMLENLSNDFGKLTGLQKFELHGFTLDSRRINLNDIHAIGTFPSLSVTDLTIERNQNISSLEQFLHPECVPAIKKIRIEYCTMLATIPTEKFGDLHFLEELDIGSCPNIRSQRLVSSSLKKLILRGAGLFCNIDCCSLTYFYLASGRVTTIQLQTWSLPSLRELTIICQSLTSIGGSITTFSSLTVLTVKYCYKLLTLDDLLTQECLLAIEEIHVTDCLELLSLPFERFGSSPNLKHLVVDNCPSLNWQRGLVLPSSLQRLSLQWCGNISPYVPSCLQSLTSLVSLEIGGCNGITSIPGNIWHSYLASLENLVIQDCPNLVSIGGANAVAQIKKVMILRCPNLEEAEQINR
ncbi:putative disease resistance protein RGA4 [Triticum dicoccoides]|uniref:putative disease resistance protein RGA4 n=1 Tax=Triticum dicoccoides TaxID=85692 RepID=UPI00188F9E35|nr:putative disease resistance protein RGA4 [Triticum dicoccoides]